SNTFRLTQSIARDLVICQAFIVRTRMQQGGLTATLWLFDPGWPLKFYRDRTTAQDWATTMVERFERQRWRDPPAL
ncbi:MAG: hypothetical protein AAF645_22230, partial [Myxococcota bacterium]